MKQTKLAIDLERKRLLGFALNSDQRREIVLLLAQAIVAVHRGARDEQNEDARPEDDDDADE